MTTATRSRSARKAAPPAAPSVQLTLDYMIANPDSYNTTITPAIAAELLERNTDNRKPKQRKISVFANDMRRGHWRLTNQGIGVDVNGVLVDGQNRLMACLAADTPFPTLLVTGLEPQAREVVDTGTARTFADVLRMNSYVNHMQLAGGANLRKRYETLVAAKKPYTSFDGRITREQLGHQDMLEFVRETESLRAALHPLNRWRTAFPRIPASAVIVFESLAMESDPEALEEFRESVLSGANLEARDPRLVLRNVLLRAGSVRKGGPNTIWFLCIMIKAWNDWRNGLAREVMNMRENEVIPVLDGAPSWQARTKRAR